LSNNIRNHGPFLDSANVVTLAIIARKIKHNQQSDCNKERKEDSHASQRN
jgi:hypothetical protein